MMAGGSRDGVSPRAQLRALSEDSPRWHIIAAEEALDEGALEVARAALSRARAAIVPGSAEEDEADFASVRLAIVGVDVRQAAAEVERLVRRHDPADSVWNLRIRALVESAPLPLGASLRERLLALLPPVPEEDESPVGHLNSWGGPLSPLLDLPGGDEWPARGQEPTGTSELPPIPTVSPFERASDERVGELASPPASDVQLEANGGEVETTHFVAFGQPLVDGSGGGDGEPTTGGAEPDLEAASPTASVHVPGISPAAVQEAAQGNGGHADLAESAGSEPDERFDPAFDADVQLLVDETLGHSAVAPGFVGRVTIGDEVDPRDADALRERLVEEMLARFGDDQGQLLFDTASTFLNNAEFGAAELLFSAAMQVPEIRVAACEGLMQSLIGAGRFADAVSTASRACRIFARDGDALLGIVYLQGVAAQELGDYAVARACFARVAATAHAIHFPELEERERVVR